MSTHTYFVNLGCRWNSPPIGEIWQPANQNSNKYRYLQYTLQYWEGPISWFNFSTGDTLQFQINDLSDSSYGAPTSWELGLSFTSIPTSETTGVATSYNPANYVDTLVGFSSPTTTSPYYLDYQGSTSTDFVWNTTTPLQSPWGTCYGWSTAFLSFNFSTSCNCELSFRLKMTRACDPHPQTYISDPETRVTSGST